MALHLVRALWFLLSALLTAGALLGLARAAADVGRLSYAHPLMRLLVRWTPPRQGRFRPGVRRRAFNPYAWGWVVVAFLLLALLRPLVWGGPRPAPAALVLAALLGAVHLTLVFYLVVVLAEAFVSWFAAPWAVTALLGALAGPVLNPLRRLFPARHGLDFSPFVAVLVMMTLLVLLPRG